MVILPADSFKMGSGWAERDWAREWGVKDNRLNREIDPKRVTIPRPFAIGQTEVTVNQWRDFVNQTGYAVSGGCSVMTEGTFRIDLTKSWQHPGFNQSGDHPVTCVSWNDAQVYVAWLNTLTGGNAYRLPTEVEWEYAARAGSTYRRPWGDDDANILLCQYANTQADMGANVRCVEEYGTTAPVNSTAFKPNPFQLAHMLGNVWEWTADCYQGTPPQCERSLRGASWLSRAGHVRPAARLSAPPDVRRNENGFRVAKTLSPANPPR